MQILTNNIGDFTTYDINILTNIFKLYSNKKLTRVAKDYFYSKGKIEFFKNNNSNYIFLSDQDYNTILINPNKKILDLWINTPYYGVEGFLSIDLIEEVFNKYCVNIIDDIEYLYNFKNYMSKKELRLFNEYCKKYKINFK